MITYGGVELLLEDAEGVLGAWLEQYFAVDSIELFGTPPGLVSERRESRTENATGCGLPVPNDPPRPPIKINSLYWPTGASRWATFYGLVDSLGLATLNAAVAGGNVPLPLVLTDQDNALEISCDLYTIDARLITATVGDAFGTGLYLLCLVDQRYWWQTANVGELQVALWNLPAGETPTTWGEIYTQIGDGLGVAIEVDSIAADYQYPDPVELRRPFECAAVLLDAVAASVGQRIVVWLDGTVHAQNALTAITASNASLADLAGFELAGGSLGGTAPAEMVVTFQRYFQGAIDPTGNVYQVTIAEPNFTIGPITPGTVKTVHSSALADFSDGSLWSAVTPQNQAEVLALATQIAADYFQWLNARYDVSYQSLQPWTPCGLDDHVEWCFGRRQAVESGEAAARLGLDGAVSYQCYTRAMSRPVNFGEEEQLSQYVDTAVFPNPTMFVLTAQLDPFEDAEPTFAAAVHRYYDPEEEEFVDSESTLVVWDDEQEFPCLIGQFGWAWFSPSSLRWEVLSLDNRFLRAKLDADLAVGGSSTATVWTVVYPPNPPGGPGVDTETLAVLDVWEWNTGAMPSGAKVYLRWSKQDLRWYVIGAASKCILGKTLGSMPNNSVQLVEIYSVPQGPPPGEQGDETDTDQDPVEVCNKTFGFIPNDTWVICVDDGDGYYVASCEQSDHLVGRLDPSVSGGAAEAYYPPTQVSVRIQPNDQANTYAGTEPVVEAMLRFAPLIDGEQVAIVWTGSVFTIIAAELDGGFYAYNEGDNFVLYGQGPSIGNKTVTNGTFDTPLGTINVGQLMYLTRNYRGFHVVAAACAGS